MTALTLFAAFFLLLLLGVPVGTSLGVSGILTVCVFGLGTQMVGPNFVAGIASFPLLAIPFFILAGVIMQKAGLAARIAEFFELLVGKAAGGLAVVAVLTCIFWGAISGSGPATTAAVGMIMIVPMLRQGYDRGFAAATIANASDLSIIIPPSIAFIIYGTITNTSVSALFLAGIVPGIIMGAGCVLTAWLVSRRRGYRGGEGRGSGRQILRAFRDAIWALLSPVIILGGIYSGIFTPTEAAVVAVFYSLLVAVVIYRSITLKDLVHILSEAAVTSSVIMFIVAFAGIFAWTVAATGLTDLAAGFIVKISSSPLVVILLINCLLLVMGMFLDAISISYLVMPILIPVLSRFGIDPLWYGVIFISALAIGQATPPVGVNLFTAANLVDCDVDAVAKRILPYVVANVAILVLLSLFPALSLYLPVKLGLYTP